MDSPVSYSAIWVKCQKRDTELKQYKIMNVYVISMYTVLYVHV